MDPMFPGVLGSTTMIEILSRFRGIYLTSVSLIFATYFFIFEILDGDLGRGAGVGVG